MLSAMPSGDTPVSKSTVWVASPRRTVTSAENPCSATSPGFVSPPTITDEFVGGVLTRPRRVAGPVSVRSPS